MGTWPSAYRGRYIYDLFDILPETLGQHLAAAFLPSSNLLASDPLTTPTGASGLGRRLYKQQFFYAHILTWLIMKLTISSKVWVLSRFRLYGSFATHDSSHLQTSLPVDFWHLLQIRVLHPFSKKKNLLAIIFYHNIWSSQKAKNKHAHTRVSCAPRTLISPVSSLSARSKHETSHFICQE